MCSCGCNTCDTATRGPLLNESIQKNGLISEGMMYHTTTKTPLYENIYRYGSKKYLELFKEARYLYSRNLIDVNETDEEILKESDLGEMGLYEEQQVPLDLILEEENPEEADKKTPQLNKPKRGGSKKFYVYVKDPKTKKIKKVSFGGTTGLKAKINDSEARRSFAQRHNCDKKKDKTKPGYWSCRLPRYAKLLGLKGSYSGYW